MQTARQTADRAASGNPLISVIIAVYNTQEELERCIESVCQQSFHQIEIILVDDGSTDSCPDICDAYAARDDRIRVIHQSNRGLSSARNEGLKMAEGEYILYVDSDDSLQPDACAHLLKGCREGIDLVAGAFYDWVDGKCICRTRKGFQEGAVYSARDFVILSIRNRTFKVQSWSFLYRRSFLIQNRLFFTEGLLYEDLDLAPFLFDSAPVIYNTNEPFYNHVFRSGSITMAPNTWKNRNDNLRILEKWKKLTDEKSSDRVLQEYWYYELVNQYLFLCRYRELSGWWIEGLDFRFAMRHSMGLVCRAKVICFEISTIFRSLFCRNSTRRYLPPRRH